MRAFLFAVLILAGGSPTARRPDGRSAQRIVSLLPSFTEILFAIGAGDRVVGRTAWCDYPPAALAVPNVGDGMPPNVEAVAARKPDLVVLYNSGPNVIAAQQLERIGIRTVLLDLNRLEDLGPATRTLGRLTGLEQRAESLAAALDSLPRQPPPTSRTSIVFVVWDNPPIIIGAGSYLHQLAALAGARNVFGDVAAPSAQVALETIAARDPQWIAVLADSAPPPPGASRVREAARMALGARGAGRALPAASRLPVWPPRPALGRSGARAAGPVATGWGRGAGEWGRGAAYCAPTSVQPMKWTILCTVAVLALVASVALGPAAVPLAELLRSDIVWNLRVPRALLAFLVGGLLGVAGASLQALVRNPLADPFLLGLSGGAGLGAVIAIALHLPGPWALPIAAFLGALAALGLVYRLGLIGGAALDPRILLLGGVAIGAFTAAITTAIVSLADAAELRNAFLWLWGGLSGASWDTVLVVALYAPIPLAVLLAASRPLDLLALGEEPARYLGADVEAVKRRVYLAASLLTAVAVAVSGVIGFVGLVVPHIARLAWGHRHRSLLPAAFIGGGALLAIADTLARTVVAPRELPVGVVTALIGVPVFTLLLRRWT